ncbi:MAG: glycosyltransferase family 2 protein [Patescibacteria group bacterium]|nr:glycosyltransferase family 2 protein [Patescibacteria group bacterium]
MAKTKKIDLSIIIISFNTKNITKNCLESINRSLFKSKIKYEIIVIDNNSFDGSKKMLEEYSKNKKNHIIYIQTNQNLGFGKGNNLGVKNAKGKYILFLNSDTIILNRSIEKLFYFYQKNETKIHFLGPKLLNKDLTPQPSAAYFFTLPVVFSSLFLKGDYWGLTRFSPEKTKKVDWISGACILTKKNYFNKLKGFDEKIFMYMEEVDLLYRANKIGFNVYFYPESKIIHLASASSSGKTFPILQVYKGFLFFYKKHYSKINLLILKFLLKLKALIAIIIGKIKKNNYLINTYEEAFKIN